MFRHMKENTHYGLRELKLTVITVKHKPTDFLTYHSQAQTNRFSDVTFALWHRWHVLRCSDDEVPSLSTITQSAFGITTAFYACS